MTATGLMILRLRAQQQAQLTPFATQNAYHYNDTEGGAVVDNAIFQLLVLVLLIVAVAAALVSLVAINRIRQQLEDREGEPGGVSPSPSSRQPATAEAPSSYYSPETYGAAGQSYETPAQSYQPAQQAGTWSSETASGQQHPLDTAASEAATAAARPSGGGTEPASTAGQASGLGGTQPASTAAGQEDPQEQPFERDGRWWYRRGDELLVYDEQSQQWMPAPSDAPAGAAPAAVMGQTTSGYASTATETAGSEAGSFWKCPSCGAVNGSTAATCRMCFTPRP